MSQSLYPTTLFHFTKQESVLTNILNAKYFKISFAREFIQGPNTNRSIGIPMVSFCDIRLSQLYEHTRNYGTFGLGMTKEWAESKGLNPVIYMSKHCNVFDNYNERLRVLYKEYSNLRNNTVHRSGSGNSYDKLKKAQKEFGSIYDLLRYMKNYQGTLKRSGHSDKLNYRFADEREWRFVPEIFQEGLVTTADLKNIATPEGKAKYNEMYKDVHLDFDYNDIKYIIVDDEKNVTTVINLLENLTDNKRILSRIICANQIVDDM